MTFVLAWKEKNDVFCISDSATTGLRDDENHMSTFGEMSHEVSAETTVAENTMKIVPISPQSAIAFSGAVYYANEYIKYLREYQNAKPFDELLISVHKKYPIPNPHYLELFIMCFDKSKGSRLLNWKSNAPMKIEGIQTYASMGSLDSWFRKIGYKQLEYLVLRAHMTPISAFHCMIIALQQLGITNLFMQQGVGGAFFGGRLDSVGFHWQEDITYILYSPSLLQDAQEHDRALSSGQEHTPQANLDIISCMVRDNAWTIYSPYVDGIKMITRDDIAPMSTEMWVDKWKPLLLDKRDISGSKYFAFVSKSGNNATIIKPENTSDNKYFSVDIVDDKTFGFTFKPLLLQTLSDFPTPNNRNETATAFNFLVA